MEVLIKCKSYAQALDIANHFLGDRPSEEFLNDRLYENSGETIGEDSTIEVQKDIIIINID